MNTDLPVVSVIVTTRNEEKNIGNCLESVKKQDYPADKIEIIVVDNKSGDKTKEIAAKYTTKIYDKGPERSAQRNFGAEKASGTYILYLDADMILSEKVISECVTKIKEDQAIGLYIPEVIVGSGFWIKVRNFERSFYNETCIDAVRFILKEKFIEIGGFDPNFFVAEDWDLDRRLSSKYNLLAITANIFHNEGRFSIIKYLNKKSHYSTAFSGYINKWGKNDRIIKKQLGVYYRFLGVFVEKGKWKKLIKHPLLSLSMWLLRLFVGLSFLAKYRN